MIGDRADDVFERLAAYNHGFVQPVGGFVEAGDQRLAAVAERSLQRAAQLFYAVDEMLACL